MLLALRSCLASVRYHSGNLFLNASKHRKLNHLFPKAMDLQCRSLSQKITMITIGTEMDQKLESYGKVSSEAYSLWFPEQKEDYEDAEFYRGFIRNGGEPALEVGCGNGRLMIPFIKEGLKVAGLDLSPYMIEICKKRANENQLQVDLYQQSMEQIKIPKKFNTIYIPYGSFMLIHNEEDACQALKGFYNHLNPKGNLLISLFIPTNHDIHVEAPTQDQWRLRREGVREDGVTVKCWENAHFDLKNQLEKSQYRYEVIQNGKIIETENENLTLHWYSLEQFDSLLKDAGFKQIRCVSGYSNMPAQSSDDEFTFIATK